jgi:hypothetical protein
MDMLPSILLTALLASTNGDALQRVLIPITAPDLQGANGTLWHNEAWAAASGDAALTVIGNFPYPAGPSPIIQFPVWLEAGGAAQKLPFFFGVSNPAGEFVFVPAGASLALQARVRDLSRQAQTWGTELPVVPESRFANRIRLLDVPSDSRFRTSLRIYTLTPPAAGPITVRVEIRPILGSPSGDLYDQAMAVNAQDPHVYPSPGYAQLALDPIRGLAGADRLMVIVSAPVKIWAFVSVTNNETQHVTVVSPQ